jgi:hypothetical protein
MLQQNSGKNVWIIQKLSSMVDVFCIIYENTRMKPVEVVLGGGEGKKRNDGRIKSNKIYFKHACKYHTVFPYITIKCQ